jgi:predicted porin
MQKKLIALAVAAITSGAAFAQSNVTIYGTVDMGYLYRGGNNGGVAKTQSQHALQSNSAESNIGFKGVEDLGNGLKAIFDLQYVITPDQNSGPGNAYADVAGLGKGHQYVGLTGGFGTAVAGQLNGHRYGLFAKYNPFGNYSVGNFASMTTQYDRASNAIAYISPSFSGITLLLATSTNTQTTEGGLNGAHSLATRIPSGGNNGDDRLFTTALIYGNGPLSLDLAYETTKAVGYNDGKLFVVVAGASYDFGMVKVFGIYDIIKGDKNSLIGGNALGGPLGGLAADQEYNRRNWEIGASVPFGKAKALFSYGQVKDKTLNNADASKISVGARYALSKRTELYTDFAHIKNDSNARFTINPMGNSDGILGGGVNGFDMGIKHSF